ncbi:hypothetical protein [Saccharomonospora iraqiensis]|uniref:hypothetical protein n=1 Tax=Saccharomonospora iraqiensis TaxID=52698 RepID=UPI00022E6127|nr:hypothetical protein [Saccharomonospora iraqiensis]
MGWFRRRQPDNPFGYEDRAALTGVGGYEPADPGDATPRRWRTEPFTAPDAGTDGTGGAGPSGSGSTERGRRPASSGALFGCAVLALVLIGVPSYFLGVRESGGDDGGRASGPVGEPSRARPVPSPEPEVSVPAAVDGWQPVVGGGGTYAYDVPPGWSPSASVLHGWVDEPRLPDVRLSTSAFLDEGYCAPDPDRVRAGSGLTVADDPDPAHAADELAAAVARHLYTPDGGPRPEVAPGERRSTTVSMNGYPEDAALRVAEVTVRGDDPCLPETALVGALAVTPVAGADGPGRPPVLVVYAGQGTRADPTRDDLVRVLESLRWVAAEDRHTVTPTG